MWVFETDKNASKRGRCFLEQWGCSKCGILLVEGGFFRFAVSLVFLVYFREKLPPKPAAIYIQHIAEFLF